MEQKSSNKPLSTSFRIDVPGLFVWNVGLAMGGMARVSQVQLLQPFVTIGAVTLFLGEPITPATIIFAIAMVMLGRRDSVTVRPSNS
ncbi:hypothetical protein QBK99_17565 [Corticibacterium sp. UT-5YL-CI-8]|nr:hypothetical protein [Tianweitania sp. UT-5YL-CI-8]